MIKDENLILAFAIGWWIGSNQKTNKGVPIPVSPGTVSKVPAFAKPVPFRTRKPVIKTRPGVIDVTNYGRNS